MLDKRARGERRLRDHTAFGVLGGEVEGGARDAQRLQRGEHRGDRERGLGTLQSCALLAQTKLDGSSQPWNVSRAKPRCFRPTGSSASRCRPGSSPGTRKRVRPLSVRASTTTTVAGEAVRHPGLLAVEHVAAAAAPRERRHALEVGALRRSRSSRSRRCLRLEQRRQEARLLSRIAELMQIALHAVVAEQRQLRAQSLAQGRELEAFMPWPPAAVGRVDAR
jgi:hypothetical protein